MNLQENIYRIKEVMGLNEQSNEVQNQLNWLRSYIMSPMYLERLKKEFPGKDQKFIENERNIRSNNLENAEYRTHFVKSIGSEPGYISGLAIPKKYEGMFYDYKTKTWNKRGEKKDPKGYDKPGHVYMEKEYDPKNWKPSPGFEAIPAHEYGHLIDDGGVRIPQTTKQKIFNYTKKPTSSNSFPSYKSDDMEFEYENTPTEFINRMQSVRYLLDKQKIYNPLTNKFSETDYNKMINNSTIKQNQHFQDIMNSLQGDENQKKKNFIDLMNTIAFQSQNTNNLNIA